MYIAITRQKIGNTYANSEADYVAYLEKENQEKTADFQEHFFDQKNDMISEETVIKEIDGNTAKLKKTKPKFYSIIVNPSQRELKHIQNDGGKLQAYTRVNVTFQLNGCYSRFWLKNEVFLPRASGRVSGMEIGSFEVVSRTL